MVNDQPQHSVLCLLCNSSITTASSQVTSMLHCCQFSGPAHLTCFHKQFKDIGNEPLKIRWNGFMNLSNLFLSFIDVNFAQVSASLLSMGSTNQATDAQITSLPNNMMQLSNQMNLT